MNEISQQNESFSQKLRSVATLGDAETGLTCSTFVARRMFPGWKVHGSPSFEEAAYMLRQGQADALLIPGAYPNAKDFLMDEELTLLEATKYGIPALVATAIDNGKASYDRLFYHPATASLLSRITCFGFGEAVQVSSNEVAAERMLENPVRYAAVTNELVTKHFGLPVSQVLRTERDMAWFVFVNRQ
jgi:hypothetical protein